MLLFLSLLFIELPPVQHSLFQLRFMRWNIGSLIKVSFCGISDCFCLSFVFYIIRANILNKWQRHIMKL